MNQTSSSERLGESMKRARFHWKQKLLDETRNMAPLPAAPPAFTIAISRESGAGGTEIARKIGKRLEWTVYDHELVEHIAQEKGVRAELIDSLDERSSSWFRECTESILHVRPLSAAEYLHRLIETLTSLAAHGNCIIVGRGATALLPEKTTLAVRLASPLKNRVKTVMTRQEISETEAEKNIAETDKQRRNFVKSHFHKDTTDPINYNLVLNTARFTQKQCVDMIVDTLRRLQECETAGKE